MFALLLYTHSLHYPHAIFPFDYVKAQVIGIGGLAYSEQIFVYKI